MDESTRRSVPQIERSLGGAEAAARADRVGAVSNGSPDRRSASSSKRHPAVYATRSASTWSARTWRRCSRARDAPIDPGDAAGMNLMDIATLRWSPAALDATAPDLRGRLPPTSFPRRERRPLSPYWQRRYGFAASARRHVVGRQPKQPRRDRASSTKAYSPCRSARATRSFACRRRAAADGSSHVFGSPTGGYHEPRLLSQRLAGPRSGPRSNIGFDWQAFSRALARSTPPGNDGGVMLPWFEPEITPHVRAPASAASGLAIEPTAARNVRGGGRRPDDGDGQSLARMLIGDTH